MRRTKTPSERQLKRLRTFSLIVDDVLKILRRAGAPVEWGRFEAEYVIRFFIWPDRFQPEVFGGAVFMGMMATAPDAMVTALPKIRNLVYRVFRSPQSIVMMLAAIQNDGGKVPQLGDSRRFWTAKARDIARELRDAVSGISHQRVSLTTKNIEHARRRLREIISPSP